MIERYFWVCLGLSVVAGLTLPRFGALFTVLLVPLLILLSFLTCLRVDIADVLLHVRQPMLIAYVAGVDLLAIPAATYLLARAFLSPDLAIGLLLLTAMPAGISSPFFTGLAKGNVALALVVSLVTSLLAPVTVTGLLFFLTSTAVRFDLAPLFGTLVLIVVVPFLASQLVRAKAAAFVVRTQAISSSCSILALFIFTYSVVAGESREILSDPPALIPQTLLLYGLFILLHAAGYWMAPWRDRGDRIALSVTRAYMSNGSAIVVGYAFFSPRVALLMVLSEAPWNTLLGPFKSVMDRRAPHESCVPHG